MKYLLLLFICASTQLVFAQQKDSTRKQFLGVLTLSEKYKDDKSWTKEDEAVIGEHFQRLIKYKMEGVIVLAGRTNYETSNPDMMGLVIFYAKDDTAARQFMMDDPAVKHNIMLAKVHPYAIALSKCQ
jgi:uncharacterized protein